MHKIKYLKYQGGEQKMLALISFILVSVGCINWFTIGILQFDFVAGIFGSQSNIFSRLIYTLVGIASIIMIINFVTNKGKFVVSFKKSNSEYEEFNEKQDGKNTARKRALATESSEDFTVGKELASKIDNHYKNKDDCECGKDCDCNKEHEDKNNKSK